MEAKEKDILGMVDNGDSTDGRDLWCTVTQALCMCVNNPKNGNPPDLRPHILCVALTVTLKVKQHK